MPLQESDNFIVGRGTDSYKITYEDLKECQPNPSRDDQSTYCHW